MEQKKLKNDPDLIGTGSQLTRYPQRACKVLFLFSEAKY